jgi:heavy metal sensor kinase
VLRQRGDIHEAYVVIGGGEVILVGRSLAQYLLRLHAVAWLMTAAAAMILGTGLLVGRWLVGLSLRPIAEISAAASKIAAGDLGKRIETGDTESELGELALVLNTTFARLEASFARQARFTADAAHELRTPIAVLLTHTQNAMAVACASEEHHEALAACQRAAQRMRSLTESLLWLARLDSGAAPPQRTRIDLAVRVSAVLELIRPLAERRRIALTADLAPAVCQGDSGQIDQVITNLLGNAIDHNVDGGSVRVDTRAGPEGAVLTVSDDGPGIDAEHLPHVFERFFRADSSRSRSSGGVGLGLAIARAIVESHGGTIRAESEPGCGAIFTVSIPRTLG